jgi:hypothetical protein
MALPFTLKKVSKGKRRIMEIQIFHHAKNIHNLQKKILNIRNQYPSRYYNFVTNLSSFNTSQNIIFQKSSYV